MSARDDRRMLADARAVEEEEERVNPINPKKQLGTRKGYTGIVRGGASHMVGAGSVPSMGLSTKRGGRKGKAMKSGEEMTETESDEDDVMGMGRALATHMKNLHGSGFYDEFRKGFEGVVHAVGGAQTGAYEGEGMDGCGTKKGQTRKTARKAYEAVTEMEGEGKLRIQHLPEGEGEEIVTGGRRKKAKRAPASASDARRRRGAAVSKLMKEKGMTLGEASKYIKQHGY